MSQMLTDDGNTWTAELQNGGEFNNDETFEWTNKTSQRIAHLLRNITTHGAFGQPKSRPLQHLL
jgi:hypothetical protein